MPDVSKKQGGFSAPAARRSWLIATSLLAGGFIATSAQAQTVADGADATSVETVIVTARKRAEDVQKVPIAITTIDANQIQEGKLDELNKLLTLVPNVSFKNDQWTSSDVSIRGSSRNNNTEEPGVGITRDGVYIGGLLTNTSTLYDLDRVEVLRGPQAGLYGRNAVGGAINFLTARPTFDRVKGYVNAQYGSLARGEIRGAVNIPISDKLAIRLSGLAVDQREGFVHVVNLDQYGDAYRNSSERVRVLFAPTDNLESLTTLEHFDTQGSATGPSLNNPFSGPFQKNGQTFEGASPSNIGNLRLNVPLNTEGDQTQFIEELRYSTPAGVATAVYGFRKTNFLTEGDNDGTIVDETDTWDTGKQRAHYLDVRFASNDFGRFRFLTGLTYMNERLELDQQYKSGGLFGTNLGQWYTTGLVTANPFGIPVGTPIAAFGLTPLGNTGGWSGDVGDSFPVTSLNAQRLKSIAAYFEANLRVSEKIGVWADVRYTRDEKTLHFSQFFGNRNGDCPVACLQIFQAFLTGGLSPEVTVDAADTFSNVSPGAGLDYTVNNDVQLYAKVVTGFKAGGFNDLASSPELLPFDSETTIGYEIGAKTRWLENRLIVNGDIFYQRRKGALVNIADPLFGSIGVSYGVNAGLIENQGAELEVRAIPVRGLNLSLAAGYLDSKFIRFVSGGVDYAGNQVPTVYRWSLSAVVTYDWTINDRWDGFSYVAYSNRWNAYTNADNARRARNPEQVDIRAGVEGGRWKIMGFINNATDHRYTLGEDFTPGDPPSHRGAISAGRTGGIEVDYKF